MNFAIRRVDRIWVWLQQLYVGEERYHVSAGPYGAEWTPELVHETGSGGILVKAVIVDIIVFMMMMIQFTE